MSVRRATGGLLGLLFGLAFASVMLTIIVAIGIWPGEAKLTAPFLCPDDRPDAFVVRDTTNPRPGETVINFSLHCVGERGEVTDVGFFRPFGLLVAFHAAIIVSLIVLARIGRRRSGGEAEAQLADPRSGPGDAVRTGRSRDADPPPFVDSSTAGPFVD